LPTIRDFAKIQSTQTRFPSQAVITNTNEKLKYQWVRKAEVSVLIQLLDLSQEPLNNIVAS
jgi:hypothetical protein